MISAAKDDINNILQIIAHRLVQVNVKKVGDFAQNAEKINRKRIFLLTSLCEPIDGTVHLYLSEQYMLIKKKTNSEKNE